jgi:PAS domain S-box-containing protein
MSEAAPKTAGAPLAPVRGRIGAGRLALFFVGYLACLAAGYWLLQGQTRAALLWPAIGIYLAFLLHFDRRDWPRIVVAALAADLAAAMWAGPPSILFGFAVAIDDSLDAVLAAYLMQRWTGPEPRHERPAYDTLGFLLLACLAAPALGAFLPAGVATLAGTGSFGTTWWNWWIGDVLGILLFAPAFTVLLRGKAQWLHLRRRHWLEGIVIILALFGTATTTFGSPMPYPFAVVPPLLWSAARFGLPGAALALTVPAILSGIPGTGGEPFAVLAPDYESSKFLVQLFLAGAGVSALALAAYASQRGQDAASAERLRAELEKQVAVRTAELTENRERLSAIIEFAAEAIVAIDENGGIEMANPAVEKVFGFMPAELLGRNVSMLMAEPFRSEHDGYLARYLRTGERRIIGQRREVVGRHKDGREFPVELGVSETRTGERRFFVGVLRDLTSEKEKSRQLQRYSAELEARVQQRTKALEREMQRRDAAMRRLAAAERMEALGKLTGGIAHDFNNLLTVIIGNHELLEPRLTEERTRTLLARAHDAATLAASLTGKLRQFSRQGPLQNVILDLNEAVSEVSILIRSSFDKPIIVSTSLGTDLWPVGIDKASIENAILNLAMNARDAMPTGGRISIETRNVAIGNSQAEELKLPPGDYVRLSFSDNGTGMSPEVIRRAFEPFFTTKAPGLGTGLGLSSVYGLMRQAGGTARIKSAIGSGTTIELYFPRSHAEGPSGAAESDSPSAPHGAGETVLIVEDDDRVRATSRQRVEELGYRALECAGGPAAIEILQSAAEIDLLFCDIVMPGGMTGIDVAQWSRTHRPEVKVLLTTGYSEQEPLLAKDAGALAGFRLLRKPYSREELARALRETLGG